jgi:hypothetical protein
MTIVILSAQPGFYYFAINHFLNAATFRPVDIAYAAAVCLQK